MTIDPHQARLRCPICGNPDWDRQGDGWRCNHCRLVVDDGGTIPAARRAIPAMLASGRVGDGDGWRLDATGWRYAAWAHGYLLDGDRAMLATPRPHDVALGMITRPAEVADAVALIAAVGDRFGRVVIVLDGSEAEAAEIAARLPGAIVEARALEGDFAAQRNRVQAIAADGWVLQLDSDERPDAALLDALGWLVAAAEREGIRSIGFPRRNLVDGHWSAHYPDIQYRLNRADIRFANAVHERPVVDYDEATLALCGAIEHRLTGARVAARTRLYEGMSAGAGRAEDEERLRRAFDAIADR